MSHIVTPIPSADEAEASRKAVVEKFDAIYGKGVGEKFMSELGKTASAIAQDLLNRRDRKAAQLKEMRAAKLNNLTDKEIDKIVRTTIKASDPKLDVSNLSDDQIDKLVLEAVKAGRV